jgi:hypothetical protein
MPTHHGRVHDELRTRPDVLPLFLIPKKRGPLRNRTPVIFRAIAVRESNFFPSNSNPSLRTFAV